ncbi:MAG: FkbM family methyltransferase [Henriciella sp.]|nr:FkbM family methyltransferase [Henriciella sp.]MBO6693957.1 FkbM family methyltransferase [Henriciella sp.]
MRYPTLQQSLRIVREISPSSVQRVIDIGVQRRTDFLMDVYPDKHHHLFEPVRAYYDDLEKNYSDAGIAYTLHKQALSDVDGTLFLHNTSVDGSGRVTHSHIKPERNESLDFLIDIEEIETRRLDTAMAPNELGDLSYLIKLDVDGVEEQIIEGGRNVIAGASFVIIEASIGRQDLCSRAALLEKSGFRMFDICDNAYYFGQLALVDLVMINNRLRDREIKFRPWQYTEGKVVWPKWQHGFGEHVHEPAVNPFED